MDLYWEAVLHARRRALAESLAATRSARVVVEGAGQWATEVYAPALRATGHADVTFTDIRATHLLDELRAYPWASLDLKVDGDGRYRPAAQSEVDTDIVFVVTDDPSHSAVAVEWQDQSPVLFAEKVFGLEREEMDHVRNAHSPARLFALDHFGGYMLDMRSELLTGLASSDIDDLEIVFVLTQRRAVEQERSPSLRAGLMIDMLPHFLAQLALLGNLASIRDVGVDYVGRHADESDDPFFPTETAISCRFTFDIGESKTVRCRAFVGKGMAADRKYLEFRSPNGSFRTNMPRSSPAGATVLIEGPAAGAAPHHPPLSSARRYNPTLGSLISKRPTAESASMVLRWDECYASTEALELIRHRASSMTVHEYGLGTDPVAVP